jgi:hypothetical protein
MIQLYAAVGRYHIEVQPNGKKIPIVTVGINECALTIEEMVLWSSLIWNILTKEELEESYKRKAEKSGVDPKTFENTLQRMEGRNLVASAKAIKGDEALYQLLANLYVVPITSSFSTKVKAFLHLIFCEKVPFSAVKLVFQKESYDQMQQKVIHLSKQTLLSSAEILKCIETGVTDVSTSEKVLDALYDDDFSTCDNLGLFMRFYDHYREILEAVATLYLSRNIVFDKLN